MTKSEIIALFMILMIFKILIRGNKKIPLILLKENAIADVFM